MNIKLRVMLWHIKLRAKSYALSILSQREISHDHTYLDFQHFYFWIFYNHSLKVNPYYILTIRCECLEDGSCRQDQEQGHIGGGHWRGGGQLQPGRAPARPLYRHRHQPISRDQRAAGASHGEHVEHFNSYSFVLCGNGAVTLGLIM